MIKAVLALSALANITLLVLWLGALRDLAVPHAALQRDHAPTATAAESPFAHWRALGLDESEAKRLLFATVEAAALAAIQSPWERYWQPGDPSAAYALALREAYARVRRELERELGPEAARSPEFKRAFRPLDAQFAFLAGAEQLELQEQRLRARDRIVASVRPDAPVAGLSPIAPAGTVSLDFLAPAAAFEVALRDSPRAEQLRRSGVVLDEHEYREAFALLEQADAAADLGAQATLRQRLRGLLGAQRFAAVAAARDPLFGVLGRVGSEHGLDAVALAAAYEVLSDAQGQLLDLAAAQVDGQRAATAAAAIATTERDRLRATVGERVAAAMLAARDEFYVGARREATPVPNGGSQ